MIWISCFVGAERWVFEVGWVVSADEKKAVGLAIDSVSVEMEMRDPNRRRRPNNLRRGNAQ